jgi:hypothetical protein
MPGPARTPPAVSPAPAVSPGRAAELYATYGTRLYRQALMTPGDPGPAEQVVCDVLVGECLGPVTPPGRGPETGGRLAVAAYWRCRELAAPRSWQLRPADAGTAVSALDPADPRRLSGRERGALALVLFGGLRYRQASQELAIPAAELSALLRTAMHYLAGLPASPGRD